MIHIVTPCTRPNNLQLISPSIPKECNWIVIFDEKCEPNICDPVNATTITFSENDLQRPWFCSRHYNEYYNNSNWNRNYVLDNYKFEDEDWIYFLDDDNIIHPNWYESVKELINIDYAMIVWGQLSKSGKHRRNPSNINRLLERTFLIKRGLIDTACFMVKYKYIKDIRWTCDSDHRTARQADGEYAEMCSKTGEVHYIPDYICYFNRLNYENKNRV